jgi:hypothetical protein
MTFLTISLCAQPFAIVGDGIGLFEPLSATAALPTLAAVCVRSALSEEGPRVKSSLLVHLPVVAPVRMLISFLALDAHRVGGSCLGFSVP